MLNRIADEYRFARLWDEHMALVTECMYALGVLMQQNLPDIQAKLVILFFFKFLNILKVVIK